MGMYKVLGSSSVSCRVASAAMAMVTAKTEDNYHMVGFSDKLVPLKIHAKMRLDEVCNTIGQVSKGLYSAFVVQLHVHVGYLVRYNEKPCAMPKLLSYDIVHSFHL